MEGLSDEDLVARTRIEGLSPSRRDEILNELFGRYHSRVAAWCLRMTGDRNSACDLAQDVLLKAWRHLDSWQGQSKFSTWLYSIMRNHCINERAAMAVRPEGASDPLDFEVSDQRTRPDKQFERQSEIRRMNEIMMSTLDRTEAQVMALHYGEEMTLDAITRLLALTNMSGAKAYIVSARRKLKAAAAVFPRAPGNDKMDEPALMGSLREGPECLPVDILSTNLSLDAGDSRRVNAEQHLRQCLHCRTQLDLLQEFLSGPVRPEESADVEWIVARLKARRPRLASAPWRQVQWATPRMLVSFSAVAAALLVFTLVPQWRLRRDAARPVPEFANEAQRTRKIEVVEKPGFFAWKPVPGAVHYELTVRTIDNDVIFHNTFTAPILAFPPKVVGVEKTGKLLEWEVVARDLNGNDIAQSGVQKLRKP